MLLERREGRKGLVGERIPLHVFDARFGLPLGPRPIRRTRPRLHVPIAAEGQVSRMKDHRAGRSRARSDQWARIVAEQGAWHSAEVRERRGDPLAPVRAALIEKRFDEEASRIAEHRDEEEDSHPHARDQQALLAEVDLQLVARRRLDAHRRQCRGPLRLPDVRNDSLDGPHADLHIARG
jgi:hypothetical protein